jgi:hypothetical protein
MEMKSIENQEVRLVTFSKRWSSIYKKASELVTLTGAEILFVVFSPAGIPFSLLILQWNMLLITFLADIRH